MNRPHFRRRPRPTDTRPWLEVTPKMLASVLASAHRREVTTGDATPLRTADYRTTQRGEDRYTWPTDPEPQTRYDAEWPDVLAAEAPGGDLAAMAAPPDPDLYLGLDWRDVAVWPADQSGFAGMARDDLGTYAEPVEPMPYHVFAGIMAEIAAVGGYDKPRGRHRQTDPLDLILADLRDIEARLS